LKVCTNFFRFSYKTNDMFDIYIPFYYEIEGLQVILTLYMCVCVCVC